MWYKALFLLAQGAFLVTMTLGVPPIFYQLGRSQGVAISLSLFLLYFVQGIFYLLIGPRNQPVKQANKVFHMMELPMVILAVMAGLRYFPEYALLLYESLVYYSCPVLVLMEGEFSLLLIMHVGQILMD